LASNFYFPFPVFQPSIIFSLLTTDYTDYTD
jgi:hypothetical protein